MRTRTAFATTVAGTLLLGACWLPPEPEPTFATLTSDVAFVGIATEAGGGGGSIGNGFVITNTGPATARSLSVSSTNASFDAFAVCDGGDLAPLATCDVSVDYDGPGIVEFGDVIVTGDNLTAPLVVPVETHIVDDEE